MGYFVQVCRNDTMDVLSRVAEIAGMFCTE